MGIDKIFPRFSWKIRGNHNGTRQLAYQVIVASDTCLLNKNEADFWDSGKIESSNTILVPYAGTELTSGIYACWKVRIWDELGNISPWSPVAVFSIGLLEPQDWHAPYIGFPTEAGFSECPLIKKSFDFHETEGKTLLYVNSLGYHEVYLNGEKIGDGILTPAVSQFDKRSLVVTYDVSSYIKKGHNDLLLWLGSGWYSDGLPGVTNKGPVVKAQLEQTYGLQKKVLLVTDTSWVGRTSGYARIDRWRAEHFGGEMLDGRICNIGILPQEDTIQQWRHVSVISVPEHKVSPQMSELNVIKDTIKPVSILPVSDKTYLVDMGKNLSGWIKIRFPKLERSQEIVMEYCDHLDKHGQFVNQRQTDKYVASGKGKEVFINKFNYHGFRYVRISNLEKAPGIDSIRGYLIHTGYEPASSFLCSDPDLNKIHDMVMYTLRCLSIGGYIVDCPQIERLGYGGDGNASTPTAQTMFNLAPLYSNWLQSWADCMNDDGGMPHTAPNPYPAGGGPYWCGFIIAASWNTFLNYGDTLILKKHYPFMQKWLGYVENNSADGLLKRWPDTSYRVWYMGDWASPKKIKEDDESSMYLVSNCFITVCYDYMQKIARVLEKTDDAALYADKRHKLQKLVHQTFYDPSKTSYATGTQIELTYPLLADIVPEDLTGAVTRKLVKMMKNKYGGHIACGLVGIPVFTEWAIKNQEANLVYSILKKKDYPGYLYMIENGATTTWEHWEGERSYIHNCYNGIGTWFYQAVGGIHQAEDVQAYRNVLIHPQVPNGITWAKTTKETPFGTLTVNWELKNKSMTIEFEVPVGISAGIVIPEGVKEYNLEGKKYVLPGGNTPVINVESGKYTINYKI